jgi:hypothetical protein
MLGATFESRGPIYEDALRALRAAFGRREPSYEGTHHHFKDVIVDPCGIQQNIPIWLGGRTQRSLRRALEHGDGWDPFGLDLDTMAKMIAKAKPRVGFELVLPIDVSLDPTNLNERQDLADRLHRYRDAGATVVNLRFRHTSLEHYLNQLTAVGPLAEQL